MKELKGIYFGANITGGEGGATTVACDGFRNEDHYLSEVDASGAVVRKADGRYARLQVRDIEERGVEVLRDVNDNPIVAPDQKLKVKVGNHELTIVGTAKPGVSFNGQKPKPMNDTYEQIRYPLP